MEKETILVAILIFGICGGVVGYMMYSSYQSRLRLDESKRHLQELGFDILDSSIQTPSVIVNLKTYDEFVYKCQEIGTTTIYQDGYSFYAFSKDWGIGYKWYGG